MFFLLLILLLLPAILGCLAIIHAAELHARATTLALLGLVGIGLTCGFVPSNVPQCEGGAQ